MRGREPLETRFWRGIEIRGFNQIKKFAPNYSTKKALFIILTKFFLVPFKLPRGLALLIADLTPPPNAQRFDEHLQHSLA